MGTGPGKGRSPRALHACMLACVLCWNLAWTADQTPSELYGDLFDQVQLERVFPDSKTFADAQGKRAPAQILADYRRAKQRPGFDLQQFVAANFDLPKPAGGDYRTTPGQDVREHIDSLWKVLERGPDVEQQYSSRIALPYRYVVPGGRFNEIYYWDSYFTMQGLEASGRHDLTVSMVRNFAWLIDRYGHIPNGNRTYFLSRSQPPFFAAMVELVVQNEGTGAYKMFLPQLQKEYDFWMAGAQLVKPGTAARRVVRLEDGTLLNRYWDDRAVPREEAWKEDIATAKAVGGDASTTYRNLRAAAESGWDFSSRWFADGKSLTSIRTTDVVPVDLNSLLYQLEVTLSRAYEVAADQERATAMRDLAERRKAAVQKLLWNAPVGAFIDYDWRHRHPIYPVTAATLYPLYFELAQPAQAEAVALTVRQTLLGSSGVLTTRFTTGEQWDAPNGWAPLQWIAIGGLRNYKQDTLAATIAQRWVAKNLAVFKATGKLVEKYDVVADSAAAGGEYPLQDGFGWTNGVLRKLLEMYPALAQ
jgi:alpha,alpha-trehalase